MGEKIDYYIVRIGVRSNDSVNALQRLLSVATGDVLLHAVKDLLDINPDIPGSNRI